MEHKHTGSGWYVAPGHSKPEIEPEHRDFFAAVVCGAHDRSWTNDFFRVYVAAGDLDKRMEAARLIAAAPELLEACKAALTVLDAILDGRMSEVNTDAPQAAEALVDAIARATGQEVL